MVEEQLRRENGRFRWTGSARHGSSRECKASPAFDSSCELTDISTRLQDRVYWKNDLSGSPLTVDDSNVFALVRDGILPGRVAGVSSDGFVGRWSKASCVLTHLAL